MFKIKKMLIVLLLLSVSILFIACNGHVHTWSTEWSKDADYHWHECTVLGCVMVSDKAAHSWDIGEILSGEEPTYEDSGWKTYTCTQIGCEQTKKVIVDKLVPLFPSVDNFLALVTAKSLSANFTVSMKKNGVLRDYYEFNKEFIHYYNHEYNAPWYLYHAITASGYCQYNAYYNDSSNWDTTNFVWLEDENLFTLSYPWALSALSESMFTKDLNVYTYLNTTLNIDFTISILHDRVIMEVVCLTPGTTWTCEFYDFNKTTIDEKEIFSNVIHFSCEFKILCSYIGGTEDTYILQWSDKDYFQKLTTHLIKLGYNEISYTLQFSGDMGKKTKAEFAFGVWTITVVQGDGMQKVSKFAQSGHPIMFFGAIPSYFYVAGETKIYQFHTTKDTFFFVLVEMLEDLGYTCSPLFYADSTWTSYGGVSGIFVWFGDMVIIEFNNGTDGVGSGFYCILTPPAL